MQLRSFLNIKWVAWFVILPVSAILAVKSLREPDVWWMLSTGRWILEHGAVMKNDVFSYTFEGVSWINVKWGFEVILRTLERIGGASFTPILQLLINIALVVMLLKSYKQVYKWFSKEQFRFPTIGLIIGSYLMLFACDFRFLGRPEMTSHLMVALFIYLLFSYRVSPSRKIYWLIPLQLIWANFHEAYGIGVVMIIAFTSTYYFEKYILAVKDTPFPKHLTFASVGALLAIVFNPNGWVLWLHPFNIYKQVGENKFTSELLSFTQAGYWEKEAYINIIMAIVILIFFLVPKKDNPVHKLIQPFTKLGLGYASLLALFFYLSLTAYRNIPFFIILSMPLLIWIIDTNLNRMVNSVRSLSNKRIALSKFSFIGLILFGVFAYGSIGKGTYFKKFRERESYGLRINPVYHPAGAARFIKDHALRGRGFSDFLTSSYLMWALYPEFKTYIDLRDLDIFTADFFQEFIETVHDPELFEKKYVEQDFNYVVLYRLQFKELHQYLYQSDRWKLAYADPVAALYLRNDSSNIDLLREMGIQQNSLDLFSPSIIEKPSRISSFVSQLFWPFYDPNRYEDIDIDRIATSYYLMVANIDFALARALLSVELYPQSWESYEMLGTIYLQLIFTASTGPSYQVKAENAFAMTLRLNPESSTGLLGMGAIRMQQNQLPAAMGYFKSSIRYDPDNLNTYLYMAECQSRLIAQNPKAKKQFLEKRIEFLEKANDINPHNPVIMLDLGIAYCNAGNCIQAVSFIKPILNFEGLPSDKVNYGSDCLARCGS